MVGDRYQCQPDADVACKLAVQALLHADIDERILAKDALGVQVGGKEAALAIQRTRRGQAFHVGGAHNVLQEGVDIVDGGVDCDLRVDEVTKSSTTTPLHRPWCASGMEGHQ